MSHHWYESGEKPRVWECRGSLPPKANPKYPAHPISENRQCFVVALTLERAVKLVREKYPDIRLHVVQAAGKVDYIVDAPQ